MGLSSLKTPEGQDRGPAASQASSAPTQATLSSVNTVFDAVTILANGSDLLMAACPTGQSQQGSAYIFRTPIAGGAATVLNTTPLYGSPAGPAIESDQILVAIHPEPEGSSPPSVHPMTGIYAVPAAGGPATPLWEGAPLVKPNRLAVVGSTLYIADMDGGPNGSGAVFSMPVGGGQPVAVAAGPPL